jgi:hypothetical protein
MGVVRKRWRREDAGTAGDRARIVARRELSERKAPTCFV